MDVLFGHNNILSSIYFLNIIFIIIIIFYEKRKSNSTIIWILILSFTHIIGFVLYIFFGLTLRKRNFTRNYYKKYSFDVKKFMKGVKKDINGHYQENLINIFNKNEDTYLRTKNEIDLYVDGKKFYKELLVTLKEAKHHIHLEYFIFNDDKIGNEIMDILVEKAKEKVEVKLIYDGMGCIGVSNKFFKKLSNAGGEVLQFFPPLLSIFGIRINYRSHRKIILIDGKYGYLGGLNIGDEYLGRDKEIGNWRDTHIRIKGSAVLGLQKEYLMGLKFTRNQSFIYRIKNKLQNKEGKVSLDKYLNYEKSNGDIELQIVTSGPDYEKYYIKDGFLRMIYSAKKSIYIQTPYFIPNEAMLSALEIACMGGIEVNIMIPNKPDHYFVYWATLSYIGDLIKVGAKCYTYEDGFLHSKVIMVDDEVASIGTSNMDIRSFYLNFEINAFIYNKDIALKIKNEFNNDLKKSKLITLEDYEKRGKIIKFKESVSRLLSPIM